MVVTTPPLQQQAVAPRIQLIILRQFWDLIADTVGERPQTINRKHWAEWISSAVDPGIISRNVRTINDAREVDRVLGRNTTRRWKHSNNLVPCWEVSGLNPLGWERTLEGVQVKPDNPPVDDKGKQKKYLGATGYGSAPLFLDTEIESYWESVLKDKLIPILLTEGGKKAGAGLTIDYATISIPGVSTCRKLGRLHPWLEAFAGLRRIFYLCFDNDVMQKKTVQDALWSMSRELAATGAKVMVVELPPGEHKGMDDFIAANGKEEFDKLFQNAKTVEEWRKQLEAQYQREAIAFEPEEKKIKLNIEEEVYRKLYASEHWICVQGSLYKRIEGRYGGYYYQKIEDSLEERRVAEFLRNYSVEKGDVIRYPFTNSSIAKNCLKWVKTLTAVAAESVNPPGLNCSNGVVRVKWDGNKPTHYLEPHQPEDYFIYEPLVEYNPLAPTTDCDRLLSCLNEPQQQVILRNLAASIDIAAIRRLRGREVRILLASGLGSNGKDSLREVVSTIFGHSGITSVSLADFASYDDGRKFALAPLMSSRVNWASENPQTARLDKIQSLKLFATGNQLHCERKGKDHIEFTPMAIGIFNVNEPPSLQGTMQAIQDRIAVLEFRKTFKKTPDPNNPNEMQADPRFAYDPEFVRTKVAPAFLNKMLLALPVLAEEGIDYECTSDAFRVMQKENNHLFQFCEDMGIGYRVDGEMSAKELWSLLENWYIDNGTLAIEEDGKRRTWIDQVKPSDKNVKGINQVVPRILALFPKATKSTRCDDVAKRNVPCIKGIGFTRTTMDEARTSSAPVTAPKTTQNQDSRTTRTTFNGEDETKKFENSKLDHSSEKNLLSDISPENKDNSPLIGAGGAEDRDNKASSQQEWCGTGAEQSESGAGTDAATTPPTPPVGAWAEVKDDFSGQLKLAQVVEHLDWEDRVALDGKDKSGILGSYPPGRYRVLSKQEMLEKGLSTKL